MGFNIKMIIREIQKLTPQEQEELLTIIPQLVGKEKNVSLPDVEFWQAKTTEQLIQEQSPVVVNDIAKLKLESWPEEESSDQIIEFIYQQRKRDQLKTS